MAELPQRLQPVSALDAGRQTNAPPRLALRWPGEVAAALGVGDDFVKRHGLIAELRAVRLGSQRFVPVAELDRWLAENARLPLEDAA